MDIKFNGRTYSYENGHFIIKGRNAENVPQRLYKYYSLSETSVDALSNMYVYATHPMQFADKDDCSKSIVTIDDIQTANIGIPKFIRDQLSNDCDRIKFFDDTYYELVYRMWGVLSLTDSYESELLWADYAKSNGVCVAFKHKLWPFKSTPYPVDYVKVLPKLFTSKHALPACLLVQCMVKTEQFAEERETRMMIKSPEGEDMMSFGKFRNLPMGHYHNRRFYYPWESVDYIMLGHQFFGDNIRAVTGNEFRVAYQTESLTTQLIDALTVLKYDIYWRRPAELGKWQYHKICIVRLHALSYRIMTESITNEIIASCDEQDH